MDGPGWLQKRYTLSMSNVLQGLPSDWVVQLFYKLSEQSRKGLRDNPGIGRLVEAKKVPACLPD